MTTCSKYQESTKQCEVNKEVLKNCIRAEIQALDAIDDAQLSLEQEDGYLASYRDLSRNFPPALYSAMEKYMECIEAEIQTNKALSDARKKYQISQSYLRNS